MDLSEVETKVLVQELCNRHRAVVIGRIPFADDDDTQAFVFDFDGGATQALGVVERLKEAIWHIIIHGNKRDEDEKYNS